MLDVGIKKGLSHFDAILVIHKYGITGVFEGHGRGGVAFTHGRRQGDNRHYTVKTLDNISLFWYNRIN